MNLTPVDFKAVAAKGCIVYCYLRSQDDENGKKFSPYYVGVSLTAENRHYRILRSTTVKSLQTSDLLHYEGWHYQKQCFSGSDVQSLDMADQRWLKS